MHHASPSTLLRTRITAMALACLGALAPACLGSPSAGVEPPGRGRPSPENPGQEPQPGAPPDIGDGSRILFIGNSLTSANRLPAMVEALAGSDGLHWEVEALMVGGSSLEDHWTGGVTPRRLAAERWDRVILQQGPSALPGSREHLRHWAAVFDGPIRGAGGRTALYMVWPEAGRLGDFDRVRDSYALAALDVEGRFLPAGESWRAAWRMDPGTALYGPDGLHPTPAGTYAAALTIYAALTGRSVIGRPAALTDMEGGTLVSLPPGTGRMLQQAADEAVAAYRTYRPADVP